MAISKVETTFRNSIAKARKAEQVAIASLLLFQEYPNKYNGTCPASDSKKPSGLCSCPECREMRALDLIAYADFIDRVSVQSHNGIHPNNLREHAEKELKAIGSPYAN